MYAPIGYVYQSNIQQVTSQWTVRVFGSDRELLHLLVVDRVLFSFVPVMVKANIDDLSSEVLLTNETFKSILQLLL